MCLPRGRDRRPRAASLGQISPDLVRKCVTAFGPIGRMAPFLDLGAASERAQPELALVARLSSPGGKRIVSTLYFRNSATPARLAGRPRTGR